MPRPIRATIDLDALRHNYRLAKQKAPRSKAWAVVKANAYGHGLLRAGQALREEADGFALLDLNEAVTLREAGVRQPILLLEGFFEAGDLEVVAVHRLGCVIHCAEQIQVLEAVRPSTRIDVFLKANTGMNRLGFVPEAFGAALARLRSLPQIGAITLMTHFADADGDRGIAWQLDEFHRLAAGTGLPVSLANSAAILHFPQAQGDWVRPGIMLYGGSPFPERASAAQIGLRPAMTLEARVIGVQDVGAGARVGYGGLFRAEHAMRVGVVACGYADGYPRHAPTGTPVLVDGVRTQLVGRVSMDMLCVDLTAIPRAGFGSRAVLWGEGLPADEVAEAAGTISYELFCALARRVPLAVAGQ